MKYFAKRVAHQTSSIAIALLILFLVSQTFKYFTVQEKMVNHFCQPKGFNND